MGSWKCGAGKIPRQLGSGWIWYPLSSVFFLVSMSMATASSRRWRGLFSHHQTRIDREESEFEFICSSRRQIG
ncbi:hypothetical protein GGU10DRAFT_341222 [Lentinula aff. detonsa]|uniref:Uncharacterized protein n=1 Tax=Lentinula aff. detonsa TaxID=2804958 RepID=A0AA38NS67_9AGAR|nr:hypothetical protein GGU10DRAFT_341222 [Lentinula aff. detonsa]